MPDAPRDRLHVDPKLPDWLPDLTVRDLRVGRRRLDIRFLRDGGEMCAVALGFTAALFATVTSVGHVVRFSATVHRRNARRRSGVVLIGRILNPCFPGRVHQCAVVPNWRHPSNLPIDSQLPRALPSPGRTLAGVPMQSPFQAFLPFEEYERPLEHIRLGEGAALLAGFARDDASRLYEDILAVTATHAFQHGSTPGGYAMSVAGPRCGALGWISDERGYRYEPSDPRTGEPWPTMPARFQRVAERAATAAGFPGFEPDACSILRYAPGARLSLHQDRSERDFTQPVVTVSLGLPATFLWGGMRRTDRAKEISLFQGDVAVWGGRDRLRFHGVREIAEGSIL
jgi:alkylated DNA repair protein (DNA oxidative demethylase)